MLQERGGIASRAIAVIVVIVVLVAGVGAYVVLTSHSSSSSSSSSQTLTTTSSTSSTTGSSTPATTTSTSGTSSTPRTTSSTSTASSTPTSSSSTSTSGSTQTTASTTSAAQTATSSSSTSTGTQSTSCATTTTSTSSAQPASVIVPLLNAYSAVSQTFQGTANGTTYSLTASYTVLYVSPTTYKVNMTYVLPDKSGTATVWLLKDGTVVALNLVGHNFTGASGSAFFQAYFVLWETELGFEGQITTSTSFSFFHSTGTSTVTVGPSTFTVTNYTANSLPETIQGCNGESITLTTGSFSVGTPSGSSYPLMIDVDVAGSETTLGMSGTLSTTTFSITSQITSVTVA